MKIFISSALLMFFFISSCSTATDFNTVYLEVGDDFQRENDLHESGTTFIIRSGVHVGQSVHNPKKGNSWIAEPGAVMDGQNKIENAFSGIANFITLKGLHIRNYIDNGIYFRQGQMISIDELFISDTGSGSGHINGAVRLFEVRDVTITNSRFTRVTSGMLITRCRGPLYIDNNQGLNIGRNFVQLDKCRGREIQIINNTMERRGTYLRGDAEDVVDWISIYQSSGTLDYPIRVAGNRARGHGNDPYGSFIMLGDDGGRNQLAIGNFGISPGQVGIGLSGGDNIRAEGNFLYSYPWDHSNVAIYSANYSISAGCDNHIIRANRTYWYNKNETQNNIWSDESCNPVVEENIYPYPNLSTILWESLNF